MGHLVHHVEEMGGGEQLRRGAAGRRPADELCGAQHQRHRPVHPRPAIRPACAPPTRRTRAGGARSSTISTRRSSPPSAMTRPASRRCSPATSTGSTRSRCRTSSASMRAASPRCCRARSCARSSSASTRCAPELKYSNVKGKNPFKDVRVRQAFYLAIDENAIADRVMRGAAVPSALMISPLLFDLAKDFKRPAYESGAGQEAAGRSRLSERLRGRDGLPERPLRQ